MNKQPLLIDTDEDIHKFVDINRNMISNELFEFTDGKETWRDKVPGLNEHIYSVDNLYDKAHDSAEFSNTDHIPVVIAELEEIKKALEPLDIDYIRLVGNLYVL
jgi:23S rRNA maturation-related 3'-5' exoribonuclease YhaM